MTTFLLVSVAYASLAALTGYLFGRCASEVDADNVAWACVFAPIGVLVALGRYASDAASRRRSLEEANARRAEEIAEAEHGVRLAALRERADEIAKI